jgi:hypothetical protein
VSFSALAADNDRKAVAVDRVTPHATVDRVVSTLAADLTVERGGVAAHGIVSGAPENQVIPAIGGHVARNRDDIPCDYVVTGAAVKLIVSEVSSDDVVAFKGTDAVIPATWGDDVVAD